MKDAKKELLAFLAGLAMLTGGLFILSQKVIVHSSVFSGFGIGGMHFTSGLVVIPLIIGIVWMFATGGSIGSKICTFFGAFIIVLFVILSTSIHLTYMTLFDWILLLVLIFGGAGLLLRTLVGGKLDDDAEEGYRARRAKRKGKDSEKDGKDAKDVEMTKADQVNAELEEMKKNL